MSDENSEHALVSGLETIPDRSSTVKARAQDIETELDEIEEVYDQALQRAEEGVPQQYQWEGISERPAGDTTIAVTQSLDKLDTDLFPSGERTEMEVEADTAEEYVRSLVSMAEEKRELESEFRDRIESAKSLSSEAMEEFLHSTQNLDNYDSPADALEGSFGEKLDQKLRLSEGKQETQRILESIVNRAQAERQAVENELENVVNEYVDQIYDQSQVISQRLGGKGRPYTGELDLLDQLSRTRAAVIENRLEDDEYSHNSDDVAKQEGALQSGKRAMEAQAHLIAQYVIGMDEAREDAENLIQYASDVLDDSELEYAQKRIRAIEEGYEGLGNAFEEDCYDSLAEAIEATMRNGMMEGEELETSHSFSFDSIPYLGEAESS
jgi:hypothetical protein